MHEKWFIGCTHFFHANTFLKFKDTDGNPMRPFKSIEHMHAVMVYNWNRIVGVNDYVYHLGDVTFRYDRAFKELMYSLNGKKRLIVGNHDKLNSQSSLFDVFEKVEFWKGFKEGNFTCTHVPQRLDKLRDGAYNVHAHIHNNMMDDLHYINVCVEVRDYTPVHMDQILLEIRNNENNEKKK